MRHVSDAINSELGKLNPEHAREIRRVSSADTSSATTSGSVPAVKSVPAVNMNRKVAASRTGSLPPSEMPRGPEKPPANWPTNHISTTSGMARPGRLG